MKWISPIMSSLSGKVGGAVGSKARGGVNYLRALAIPSNPRSPAQSAVRLILTSLAATWPSLSDLQRAGWAGLATSTESGIDVFVKANVPPSLDLQPTTLDAPDSIALITVPATIPVVDASAHTITFSAIGSALTIDANVYISRPQKSSRLAQQFPFTYAGSYDDVSGGGTVTLDPSHPAYNLVAGDIVYVKIVQFGHNGSARAAQVSPEQSFRCIVVA